MASCCTSRPTARATLSSASSECSGESGSRSGWRLPPKGGLVSAHLHFYLRDNGLAEAARNDGVRLRPVSQHGVDPGSPWCRLGGVSSLAGDGSALRLRSMAQWRSSSDRGTAFLPPA